MRYKFNANLYSKIQHTTESIMAETHRKKRSFISSLGHVIPNNNSTKGLSPKRSKPRKNGFFQRQIISNENNKENNINNGNNINNRYKIPPDIITGYSFQFTLKTSDKNDAKFITFRGSLKEDGIYQIWRRVLGSDSKDIKMSPSWLYRQTVLICQGILQKLFQMLQPDIQHLTKKKLVSLCYQKLGMTKANKKLKEKELMMFTDVEIRIIINRLRLNANACDLETELFNYLQSTDIYAHNDDFMDMLDDLLSYQLFEQAIMDIYNALVNILISTKTDTKFELEWASFYRTKMEAAPTQKLIFLFQEIEMNEFRTYEFNMKHCCSVFVCSIKEMFLRHLTNIVYDLVEHKTEKKIDNSISTQYAGSYGGASLCSCLRISYSSRTSKEKRNIYVRLQKQMLCKDNEKHLIAKELKYQNMGGMYMLSPSRYSFCQRILSDLSKHVNKAFLLPSNKLPNIPKLIESYINNKQNIEEFKGFYSKEDLSKYNDYISIFMGRFVKFMCGKYYWSRLKQQDWCETGMSIRDQFNFAHTAFTNKRKKQQ
eukprot:458486_1